MKKIFCVVLLLAMSYALFSTIIYVDCDNTTAPWNGTITDPYRNIQDAVNVATNGDSIMIYDGTYIEDVDLDEFSTGALTLQSTDPTNQSIVESTVIKADDSYAFYRSLYMSSATFYFRGLTIADSDYGIYLEEVASTTEIYVTNCIFDNNTIGILSHSFYPVVVNNCIFNDNSTAIISTHNWTANRSCIEAEGCLIYENDNGFATDLNMSIDGCTFADNTSIAVDNGYGDSDITNSILWDNGTEISNTYGTVTVSYSDIQGGYLGTSNINSDPLFLNAAADVYTLTWDEDDKSPCIDTGDPSITDPDGTPSDMGAIRAIDHRIDEVELPSPATDDGWKWLSFPALDVVLDEADIAENVLDDILDPTILDRVLAQDYIIYYDDFYEIWRNIDQQFLRSDGFKFKMNAAATLEISGFKLADNATVFLAGNQRENWLGYWLEETQHVSDAFSDYWDGSNITSIQHQYWSASYFWGQWWYQVYSGREPTLSYGDMVIVKCDDDIDYFSWNNDTPPEERTTYSETEYFSFEEQQGYTPIYVELDENDLPQEVGAFVNGVCIGAKVVEDTLCQINAYTSATQAGELEFQFYYGTRAPVELVTDYRCIDPYRPEQIREQIDTSQPANAWLVSFKDGFSVSSPPAKIRVSNYPNPFNPTTTISYSLPQKTDMLTLEIYNIKGQKVKTLLRGEHEAGTFNVTWQGKDDNGNKAASGIYFYKLSTPEHTLMKKMLLLK